MLARARLSLVSAPREGDTRWTSSAVGVTMTVGAGRHPAVDGTGTIGAAWIVVVQAEVPTEEGTEAVTLEEFDDRAPGVVGPTGAAPSDMPGPRDLGSSRRKVDGRSPPSTTTSPGQRSVSYTHLTLPTKRIV